MFRLKRSRLTEPELVWETVSMQDHSFESNPYRSPQMQDMHPSVLIPGGNRAYTIAAALQCLTILIGVPLAVLEIETILGSGPILLVFGLLSLIFAIRRRYLAGIVFGASGLLVVLGSFLLINLMGWGPREAHEPIGSIAVVYGCVFGLAGLYSIIKQQQGSAVPEPHHNDSSWEVMI